MRAPEHEVTERKLVVALLRVDYLTVVQDLELKQLLRESFDLVKLASLSLQLDVDSCHGMVRTHDHLLFEDDTVLAWEVLVAVL